MSNANANQNDNLTIGKYRLVNCLASGQHSQVWEVTDSETTRKVAMKLLLPVALKDSEQVSALKSEFKIGSSFDHPNIIKYYEAASTKQNCYFTMELFPAPNLKAQIFNDIKGVHSRFNRLVEQVAMALEHIHERGWVHRDIKPDNILMNKSAEVRIIDFSLSSRAATALSKVFARKQSVVKGTRTYMAPEQILGKPLTPQTDIYNFGITLYELLTGQPPFAGTTPKDLLLRHLGEPAPNPCEFNTNLTPEIGMIILRMLSKKPEQRQKKMSEFIVEFRNVKVFKEEIVEGVEETEEQKAEAALNTALGERLDSRLDALRTKMGISNMGGPEPKKKAPKPPPPAARPAAPPAPQQPGMPQMMPGMPMAPMPMMPYPMQPMPGMPMPGVGMPMPQMMPQMPMPQMPMQPMPQAPMPGQMNPAAGPMPWVAAPQAPPAGAWGGAAAPPAPAQPARPAPLPVPAAAIPAPVTPAARPTPPPVAPTAVPQVTSKPAAPVAPPPRPAPPKPKPPVPAAKPEETFKIDDLLGFDELPPAV